MARARCDLVACEMLSRYGLLFIWERDGGVFLVAAECFPAVAVEHFAACCKTLADHSVMSTVST